MTSGAPSGLLPRDSDHPPRRLPIGAEPGQDGTSFRVWAPSRERVAVTLMNGGTHPLAREASGHFSGFVRGIRPGARYGFSFPGECEIAPDPASRWQPDGPEGWSVVVDPAFAWTDDAWPGLQLEGQVLCEIHVGTLTPEGTWRAAAERLRDFRDVGITALEIMPVADHPGRFGWGYDGVALFAPNHNYGTPEDFRRFVDEAHRQGVGVVLDVVYNHFGPEGGSHHRFARTWWNREIDSEWGAALNFDRPGSEGVREFVLANVRCLIGEYHLDGLRIDATQAFHDGSGEHILSLVSRACRDAAGGRRVLVLGENEPQQASLMRPPAENGSGFDALWNDDFHHSALVAATGRREAYFTDHQGTPQELVSAAKYGYLFQGQRYSWQDKGRGSPAFDIPRRRFIDYLENHDQLANQGRGHRLHQMTSPGRFRALTALQLLLPGTPLLFQGAHFCSSKPFLYFADFGGELGERIRSGRLDFVRQFASLAAPDSEGTLPDPAAPETFESCKLDWSESERNSSAVALHRDLISLRRSDPVLTAPGTRLDGAVVDKQAFVLRFFGATGEDRLLVVNLGSQVNRDSIAEPLVAPPAGSRWQIVWSSEDPRYGGAGTPPVESDRGWRMPAEAAILMGPAHVES
ncbi:malto-oligosyltrehalose trehalohydrolase [Rhizobiales bacterium L72]|uniref:Malto-oligosyltrehalose trehalohydrolase n=2 Tax=Propylenella binzhouense TaxID=2555902 RepID=A0A964T2Q7_9HYPH|nr:malto-oligosyltrehalose trehalohydrolase [Propylenella binzhouense]MYZ46497.1 malto-oligosyltrehalose trehalohydrolase [Propylenella binzhouense]